MKCLVTGGAGFIGSNLVEKLLEQKHQIVVIDDLSTGRKENLDGFFSKIKFYQESILNFDNLKNISQGCEIIFHQAAIPSVVRSIQNPRASSLVNIEGTLNVLLCAKELGIRRVVIASSSSVYGDTKILPKKEDMVIWPKSPYALTKLVDEHYGRIFSNLYDLETVCLRYFNVFGPRQNPNSNYAAVIPAFIKAVANGQSPIIHGDGEQTRDFTFINDVVRANILASKVKISKHNVINIASGRNISINNLLQLIIKIIGKNVPAMRDEPRLGDVRDTQADIKLAKKLLNYSPNYNLEEGLRETVKWFYR
ncbi:MAG: SDR family oxidoreductase [Candidatus Gottesmanbacteria bacterium]